MHKYVIPTWSIIAWFLTLFSLKALVIPAAYHSSKIADDEPFGNDEGGLSNLFGSLLMSDGSVLPARDPSRKGLVTISRGTAVLLLFVYVGYLIFQVRSSLSKFQW